METSSVITSKITFVKGVFRDLKENIIPVEIGNRAQISILQIIEKYQKEIETNGGIILNSISNQIRNKFKVNKEYRAYNIFRFICFCNTEIIITLDENNNLKTHQPNYGGSFAYNEKFQCDCCYIKYKIKLKTNTSICLKIIN